MKSFCLLVHICTCIPSVHGRAGYQNEGSDFVAYCVEPLRRARFVTALARWKTLVRLHYGAPGGHADAVGEWGPLLAGHHSQLLSACSSRAEGEVSQRARSSGV